MCVAFHLVVKENLIFNWPVKTLQTIILFEVTEHSLLRIFMISCTYICVSVLQSNCDNTLLKWIGNTVYHTLKFITVKGYHDNLRNNIIETLLKILLENQLRCCTGSAQRLSVYQVQPVRRPKFLGYWFNVNLLISLTLHVGVRRGLFRVFNVEWQRPSSKMCP